MQLYIYSNRILCVSQLFLMIIIENYMITVNTSPQFFAQSQYPKHFFLSQMLESIFLPDICSFFSFALHFSDSIPNVWRIIHPSIMFPVYFLFVFLVKERKIRIHNSNTFQVQRLLVLIRYRISIKVILPEFFSDLGSYSFAFLR